MKSSHSRSRVRPPSLQKQIVTLVNHWRPILGLESWGLDFRYNEREHLGWCIAKPHYQEAMIGFNIRRIKAECWKPEQIEDLVVHEMVHCVIWKSSERAVSQMTRSILRAAGRRI
jgi:hypothetical protein